MLSSSSGYYRSQESCYSASASYQWGLGKHLYHRACSDFSVWCASWAWDNVGSVVQGLGIDWGIPRD